MGDAIVLPTLACTILRALMERTVYTSLPVQGPFPCPPTLPQTPRMSLAVAIFFKFPHVTCPTRPWL